MGGGLCNAGIPHTCVSKLGTTEGKAAVADIASPTSFGNYFVMIGQTTSSEKIIRRIRVLNWR
jgi:hypothetical protein